MAKVQWLSWTKYWNIILKESFFLQKLNTYQKNDKTWTYLDTICLSKDSFAANAVPYRLAVVFTFALRLATSFSCAFILSKPRECTSWSRSCFRLATGPRRIVSGGSWRTGSPLPEVILSYFSSKDPFLFLSFSTQINNQYSNRHQHSHCWSFSPYRKAYLTSRADIRVMMKMSMLKMVQWMSDAKETRCLNMILLLYNLLIMVSISQKSKVL